MFALPLFLFTLVVGLISDRSVTRFWSVAALTGAAEIIFLYWATHRGKRTGMIHVHARPLLVAAAVAIGTMATLPVLQHSEMVLGRDHLGRQTVGGWGIAMSLALAWGSA